MTEIDVVSIGSTDVPRLVRAHAKTLGLKRVRIESWQVIGEQIKGKPCVYRVTISHA